MSPSSILQRLGVCSWSLRPQNPDDLIAQLKETGLTRLQLALAPLRGNPGVWGDTPAKLHAAGITIVSGMFGTIGENYSTLETIKATGGIVPDATWRDNWERVQTIVAIAQELKIPRVSSHAGFIPPDAHDPTFAKLADRIRQIADLFASRGMQFILETGQETADTLVTLMRKLEHPALGVNFDPANMILYAKGDPIASLAKLLPWVRQIHIKDAVHTQTPGTWGKEKAVGVGDVDWPAFCATLKRGNYTGDLVIEREGGPTRIADIKKAVELITRLMA